MIIVSIGYLFPTPVVLCAGAGRLRQQWVPCIPWRAPAGLSTTRRAPNVLKVFDALAVFRWFGLLPPLST